MSKTYRPYEPDQIYLFPPSPRDWLPDEPAGAFEQPDARRRFLVVSNLEETARASTLPWEK